MGIHYRVCPQGGQLRIQLWFWTSIKVLLEIIKDDTIVAIDEFPILLLFLILVSFALRLASEPVISFEFLGKVSETFYVVGLLSFLKRLSYK